jgi:hypothetical protein
VPLLICSDWLKQVKFKECHLALLGFSDVHGRVPNGTLGSERVNVMDTLLTLAFLLMKLLFKTNLKRIVEYNMACHTNSGKTDSTV